VKPLAVDQILDPAKVRAIRVQSELVRDGEFFLAGGTGLGLRLRHRRSRDLDWFTAAGFDAARLGKRLESLSERPTKLEQDGPSTIRAYYGELETSFIRYTQVSGIPESLRFGGVQIPVADIELIAAMKAAALHDRGKRRDFIDIHAIAMQPAWSVARFIEHSSTKLPLLPDQIARALTYFPDADKNAADEPIGYATRWEIVKKDLIRGVQEWERDRRDRAQLDRSLLPITEATDRRSLHQLGLHPETLADERFARALRQSRDGTIAFPFRDAVGVVGALLHGERAMPPVGRPERGIWSSAQDAQDGILVIVDSPLDALSYHQANPNARARYVATGTDINREREAMIRDERTALPQHCRVVLAFPRTSRGASLAAKVELLVSERQPSRHLPERGSSWSSYVQEQQREWIRGQGLRRPGRDRGR
jgi:hypothetical protein